MTDRVSILKIASYDKQTVEAVLHRHFALLGGITAYIKPGMRVLIKPNLLMPQKPSAAITTHPHFVEALAKLCREAGAKVTIADSGGGPYGALLQSNLYRICGMTEAAQNSGAQLGQKIIPEVTVALPEGTVCKKFEFVAEYGDCDFLISFAKCKTHMLTGFTGAVKNLFGLVPGLLKSEFHFRFANKYDFTDMLIDLSLAAKPGLSFMDGVLGMEGNGPSGGKPRKFGFCLASPSPYALDLAAIHLLGLKPQEALTVAASIQRGLVCEDFNDLELVGDAWADLVCLDLCKPKRHEAVLVGRLPHRLRQPLTNMLTSRVQVDAIKCIGCGRCRDICPQKTIRIVNQKASIDRSKCIRCYCCHEICPVQAIKLKRPMFWHF